MKLRGVFAVLLFTLLFCSCAFADTPSAQIDPQQTLGTWTETIENGIPVFTWSVDCWDENCTTYLSVDYSGDVGDDSGFELRGEKDNDPVVSQTVYNGSGTTWLDWHVDILNGTIDRNDAPVVYNLEGAASNWEIYYLASPGYTDGFGAVWTGGDTSVMPGESLSIRFRWAPTGTGTVSIHQYPTDTGQPIPEPGSLLALSTGLGSLAFAFYRRRS